MARRTDSDVLPGRVLRSSRLRTVVLLLGSALFTAGGGLMVRERADWGWATLAFGLVGVAVFLFTLVRPNRLELSAGGFTTVTLGRRWSVDWGQCGEFRIWRDEFHLGSPWMVVFDCTAPSVDGHVLEAAAVVITGSNAALPETYGMSAAALATLLNRYRQAAGGPKSGTGDGAL